MTPKSHPKIQLAALLKQKRIAAGLSQGDVAMKMGYSTPQFISNWERGIACPPVRDLKKLADILKTSPEELFEVFLEGTISHVTHEMKRKFFGSKFK